MISPMRRMEEQAQRLKQMGRIALLIAAFFSLATYFFPLEGIDQEGVYVMSALFSFFGLYCLGATWRKKNFV